MHERDFTLLVTSGSVAGLAGGAMQNSLCEAQDPLYAYSRVQLSVCPGETLPFYSAIQLQILKHFINIHPHRLP